MPPSRTLRVETLAPAVVHWSVDGWRTVHDTSHETRHSACTVATWGPGPGPGDRVHFTFYWPEEDRWEGVDFLVCVE